MNRFMKVTVIDDSEIKTKHCINLDSIESFKDKKIRLKNGIALNIVETKEELDVQHLRDGFAMAALTGLLSHYGDRDEKYTMSLCYYFADEVLKERSK